MITTRHHRPAPEQTTGQRGGMVGKFVNLMIIVSLQPPPVELNPHAATPLELAELREDLLGITHLLQEAGGEIAVVNKSETEKIYSVYLPVAHRPPALPAETENVSPALRPDLQTILVVDDEDTIRALIREALQAEGYRVLEAGGPKEALDLASQYQHIIHLLVSDVVMPGMNGQELANQLRVERPSLKLLFISGHSMNLLRRSGIDSLGGRFLRKPFSTSTLVENVRASLAPSASRSQS